MSAPALGEAATQLPWLFPGASTLVALARAAPGSAWDDVRVDPGGVLLVLRQTAPSSTSPIPALVLRPDVLDGAVRILDQPGAGFVDWNEPNARAVYCSALAYAQTAQTVAQQTQRAVPLAAWCAALLAPLGWMAITAVAPNHVGACLDDLDSADDPSGVQVRLWGLDAASIGRRLCRRWGLPTWLSVMVGHLDLPVEHAAALGAEGDLFRIVQLAVALVESQELCAGAFPRHTRALGYIVGTPLEENARALGLDGEALASITETVAAVEPTLPRKWEPPTAMPLLRDLLLLAAEKRRLAEAPALVGLEADIDHLHHALREQRRLEAERLRKQKLSALAEFAAGAGHEINNPLAVISGQAQYLLNHEPDPARQRSLQTIVAQTKRIHQILSELMLFARPPKPKKQPLDAVALTHEIIEALGELAAERRVTLGFTPPGLPVQLLADPKQLRTALLCLVRNALEAAPADGWASIRLEVAEPDRAEWLIEDNGPGLSAAQAEHMFDPFYSGRQAGRGRGLGLPTAWQLARNHGGDVTYAGTPAGYTRFVLSLPVVPLPAAPAEPPLPAPVAMEAPALVPLNGR